MKAGSQSLHHGRSRFESENEKARPSPGGPLLKYRTIVFDFDGTLADSLANLIAAFRRVAPPFGLNLSALDPAAARTMPTRDLFRQLGVGFWKLPRLLRAVQNETAKDAAELKLFAGVPEVLADLTARGCRLGILSSNREDAIRTCLRANGVEGRFAFVVGYPRLFGKARALRRILRRHGIAREETLYVGDELRDLEAARRAGIAFAAVTWGFNAEESLAKERPTFLARTPAELLSIEPPAPGG